MNVLVYNWKDKKNPDRGGAEIIVFRLLKSLVEKGHHVTLFSRSFPGALPEETIDGVHVVRRGGLLTTYWYGYRYYKNLPKKPDIVIDMLNTLFWFTPLYVRGKVVAYVNQLAKEVLYFELPPVISHIAAFLERLEFLPYRLKKVPFVCYAASVKADLVQYGIAPGRVSLFSLGIDHKQFFPGKKSPTPLFLCINRLVKMKRTDLCIQAMAEVVKQYPAAQLEIIGFGYDKPRLERLITKLGLQQNVHFRVIPFFAKAEEVRTRLMQNAWALLFPSVKEGWGMTVTECAACGTPAIVSNVTGLRDAVQQHKTGIILTARPTPTELARAMIKIIKDASLRHNLSAQAIKWGKNFTWEKSSALFQKRLGI